ncbi:hypothetical protein NUH87_08935 [Pseudomonas batumici]|uniref:hypothetical protein n=1 Tax=Pseudomonas batumici TaxID=226910 RepID=UPI0030D3E7D2
MKVSSIKLQAFLWALPFFFGSLLVFPYALLGDQEFYRHFYAGVAGLPVSEAFQFYRDSLGTSEPGYFLFSYVVAPFFDKDLIFSIVNFFFGYHIFLWMLRNNVSRILFPAVYLNFYVLVLAFSAERLKLSLLFFLMGSAQAGFFRYFFYAFSVLTHVQTLMLLVAAQVRKILFIMNRLLLGRIEKGFLSLSFLMVGIVLVLIVLREHIESKISFYAGAWGGVDSILKPVIFTVLSICYARSRRVEALLASLPMVLAAYFIGAERVVIFSYFVFMYYGLQSRRGMNVSVVLTLLYFIYKGVEFLTAVVLYGDGFASVQ